VFRVRPPRIDGMKSTISAFAPEKRPMVRTLSVSCGTDQTATCVRGRLLECLALMPRRIPSLGLARYFRRKFSGHIDLASPTTQLGLPTVTVSLVPAKVVRGVV
jgi:hypothetical protein